MRINEVIEEGFWGDLAKGTANKAKSLTKANTYKNAGLDFMRGAGFGRSAELIRTQQQNKIQAAQQRQKALDNRWFNVVLSRAQNNNNQIDIGTINKMLPKSSGYWAGAINDRNRLGELINNLKQQGITVTNEPGVQAPPAKQRTWTTVPTQSPGLTIGKEKEPLDLSKFSPAAISQLRAQGAIPQESKEIIMKSNKEIVKEMAIRRAEKESISK
jgi:hypothetical protein